MNEFTLPSTVHRMDHTGRGVQQGPQHGCEASALAAAEILMAKDEPTQLNPHPLWWVATKQADGTSQVTHLDPPRRRTP